MNPELSFILPALSARRGHIRLLRTERMTLNVWSLTSIAPVAALTAFIGRQDKINREKLRYSIEVKAGEVPEGYLENAGGFLVSRH